MPLHIAALPRQPTGREHLVGGSRTTCSCRPGFAATASMRSLCMQWPTLYMTSSACTAMTLGNPENRAWRNSHRVPRVPCGQRTSHFEPQLFPVPAHPVCPEQQRVSLGMFVAELAAERQAVNRVILAIFDVGVSLSHCGARKRSHVVVLRNQLPQLRPFRRHAPHNDLLASFCAHQTHTRTHICAHTESQPHACVWQRSVPPELTV